MRKDFHFFIAYDRMRAKLNRKKKDKRAFAEECKQSARELINSKDKIGQQMGYGQLAAITDYLSVLQD